MQSGRVEQAGTPTDIYHYPRTAFVADFVGSANLIRGKVVSSTGDGSVSLQTTDGDIIKGVTCGRAVGAEGMLSVRTVHLALSDNQQPG